MYAARLHEEIRPKLLETVREIERSLGQGAREPQAERAALSPSL